MDWEPFQMKDIFIYERVRGIEPLSSAWKANIIAFILYPRNELQIIYVGVLGIEPSLRGPKPRVRADILHPEKQ